MPKILGHSLAEHRERTRSALFDALGRLMSRQPFDKITLSDVAAQAGVGRTAVYNHFANKEDLLLAFMEHEAARYSQELSQALEGIQDPVDRLRVYVRQQALIKRDYHFPATGPLNTSVSRATAGRLRAHGELLVQTLAAVLTFQELTEQCASPTEPAAREAYLAALDTFVLRAVGAAVPDHAVPTVPPSHVEEPATPVPPAGARCPVAHVA